MITPTYRRPGTRWFVSDGYLLDNLPASYRRDGRPLECAARLFLFNPQSQAATVTVRFYHPDRSPTRIARRVPAGAIETVELATLPEVPHGQAFWIDVESDCPILPQARHEDFTFWDPVPDALGAVAPYPGPLADETAWVFPDCYQGLAGSWYEQETLTILNPNPTPVSVRVRYLHRARSGGAEERITIAAERVAEIPVWERSPTPLGVPEGVPVKVQHDYAMRIDADAPVIAQTTRRCRWTGYPHVVGSRSTMGYPLREVHPSLWHYPGGEIVAPGILPRARESDRDGSIIDRTWNLLFTNNLSEKESVTATLTIHRADGATQGAPAYEITPLKSRLHWLHSLPDPGPRLPANEPYALSVTGDGPIVPDICLGEFEMWSQVCPGAMAAIVLHPGPIDEETSWWLGIGQAGGDDAEPVEWRQTFHLFNPNPEAIVVTLNFLGLETPLRHAVTVRAGAAARVQSDEIEGLPRNAPFAVRATSDRSFCAQTTGRTFTRGLPHTRAMYSFLGLPMTLEAP